MKPIQRLVSRAAIAAGLALVAASASANYWRIDNMRGYYGPDLYAGTFYDNGTTFADWSFSAPHTLDYTPYDYNPTTSYVSLVTDSIIFLSRSGYTGPCDETYGNSGTPESFNAHCLALWRPVAGPDGTSPGSIFEWRVSAFAGVRETRSTYGGTYAPIPEPATAAMLLAGAGLVGWTARRRRRA